MKKTTLTFCLIAAGTFFANAQSIKFPPLTKAEVSNSYTTLLNMDMASVMKELKMTAKDTVGKTYKAIFPQIDPTNKLLALKTATGDVLAFKNNKLAMVFPK